MQISSLQDLFLLELQDIYSAENQLVEALPKMAKAAQSMDLQDAFTDHLEETNGQVQRLEKIAQDLGLKLEGKECKGMQGLIAEGEEILKQEESLVKDLALISGAQRVEHYEIAVYGTLSELAEELEYDEAVDDLQETLDEEKNTDERLTDIAESIMGDMEMAEAEE